MFFTVSGARRAAERTRSVRRPVGRLPLRAHSATRLTPLTAKNGRRGPSVGFRFAQLWLAGRLAALSLRSAPIPQGPERQALAPDQGGQGQRPVSAVGGGDEPQAKLAAQRTGRTLRTAARKRDRSRTQLGGESSRSDERGHAPVEEVSTPIAEKAKRHRNRGARRAPGSPPQESTLDRRRSLRSKVKTAHGDVHEEADAQHRGQHAGASVGDQR